MNEECESCGSPRGNQVTLNADTGALICECPLPNWLQSWSCETCDWGLSNGVCECFDIMRAIDKFRSEHPSHNDGSES